MTSEPSDPDSWRPTRAAIIGVGLLGTSVALGLRQCWPSLYLVGMARRESTRRAAQEVGAVHETTDVLARAAENADLIVVCTPVDLVSKHILQASEVCAANALITDVGSTKAAIVAQVEQDQRARALFVGSHPLAGSEKAGPWHGRAELLKGRTVVLTPTEQTPPQQLRRCTRLWQSLGAKTLTMSPNAHDATLAATSHVPHVVAAALAAVTDPQLLSMAGSGWRDTTRIASGDPGLWKAILQANAEHVLRQMDQFSQAFCDFRQAIAESRFEDVQKLLQIAKNVRDENA